MNYERDGTAWESLNKTITDLMEYMGDEGPRSKSDLRAIMNEKVADIAAWWFQEGYSIAHKQCLTSFQAGRSFDNITLFDAGAWLAPDIERPITLNAPTDNHPDATWNL